MFENFRKKTKTEEKPKESFSVSRRDFLAYGIGTAIGTVGTIETGAGKMIGKTVVDVMKGKSLEDFRSDAEEVFNQVELNEQVLLLKQAIKEQYGVTVHIEQEDYDSSRAKDEIQPNSELRLTKQIEALQILKDELARYPDFMITQYGLETISLTAYPEEDAGIIGGYFMPGNIDAQDEEHKPTITLKYDWNTENQVPVSHRVTREDIPDSKFSPEEVRRAAAKIQLRTTIHHELFHSFVDGNDSELSPRNDENSLVEKWDAKFKSKNDELRDFYRKTVPGVITNSGYPMYNQIPGEPEGVQHGYGLQSEKEDRATIIEELIFYGPELDRLEKDDLLRQKTDLLLEYYQDSSCGLMNLAYWQNVSDPDFGRKVEGHFFAATKNILETPYEKSEYTDSISKEKYTAWQNKLRTTRYANANVKN